MITDEALVPRCQGCTKPIEEGEVVAFGKSFFHLHCFICAKCKTSVRNKNDLLVQSDGKPLCENCSYNCVQCQKTIHNEAILTGDQAYHSDCFRCTSCNGLIKDLIFTQNKKGIYCTNCQYLSKTKDYQPGQSESLLSSEISSQSDDTIEIRFEPSISSSLGLGLSETKTSVLDKENSNYSLFDDKSFLSDLSSFSFFDNPSAELSNLSESLGVNLSFNPNNKLDEATMITQTRLNRASEILEKSLRTTSVIFTKDNKNIASISTSDANKLKQELADSQSKLKEMETNYASLQEASQQALNEFNKIKEDYSRESSFKQQLEYCIMALLKKNGGMLSRKELDKLASFRLDLERACKEVISYRDKIASSIDQSIDGSQILTNYQKSLKGQIKSLLRERDVLRLQLKEFQSARDEVIRDTVSLALKSTDAIHLSQNLSKSSLEKEAKSNEYHASPPLSPSDSNESTTLTTTGRPRKASDASSMYNAKLSPDQPTLARTIKKKGSTMFSKLSGSTSTTNKKPEPSFSTSSSTLYKTTTQQSSLYINGNSSSQSLSGFEPSNRTLDSKLNKKFAQSAISLMDDCQHSFQAISFIRPVKCGVCTEKIWGRSEVKCEKCGLIAHSRCLGRPSPSQLMNQSNHTGSTLELPTISIEYIQPSTSSSTIRSTDLEPRSASLPKKAVSDIQNLSGVELTKRCELENRTIPLIIQECLKEVELRGLDYEGIYRKSGGAGQTKAIQQAYDQRDKVNLSDEDEYNDICAITSALKQYFRELPNPLLTHELYDHFIKASVMPNNEEKLKTFSQILSQLPKAHFDTAACLFRHLNKVHEMSEVNRMTVKNLAMIFAPTLMIHENQSRDFLDISYKNATIEYLLLNTEQLFPASS